MKITEKTIPSGSVLSPEREAELVRLKSYYPFRIVWGAISETGDWACGASVTKRFANTYARRPGWTVVILK